MYIKRKSFEQVKSMAKHINTYPIGKSDDYYFGLNDAFDWIIGGFYNYDSPLEQLDMEQLVSRYGDKDRRLTGTEGYIYVMKCMGYYKIGMATGDLVRLGEYTCLPEKPLYEIIQYVYDAREIENELHSKYKHKRVRSEWFNLSFTDLNDICIYLKDKSLRPSSLSSYKKYTPEIRPYYLKLDEYKALGYEVPARMELW